MEKVEGEAIVILGAGGFAREVFFHLRDIRPQVRCLFADDFFPDDFIELAGRPHPVVRDWNFSGRGVKKFLVGVGSPKIKKLLVSKALAAGLIPRETPVHPRAIVQDARIGRGGIICPGVTVTTNITIGDYVTLNPGCTVGHDAVCEDFVSCNPGSAISGASHLGEGVLLGAGAVVREGVKIAADVTIGAQAFVSWSVTEPGVVLPWVPRISKGKKIRRGDAPTDCQT